MDTLQLINKKKHLCWLMVCLVYFICLCCIYNNEDYKYSQCLTNEDKNIIVY